MRNIGRFADKINVCQHLLFVLVFSVMFQNTEAKAVADSVTYYYIDLLENKDEVYTVFDNLSLKYEDRYGQSENFILKIFNAERKLMAQMKMTKTFGLNYYNININELPGKWEKDQFYTLETINEMGRKYSTTINLSNPPETEPPYIDIYVNPIYMDCKDPLGNLVEFYGIISGGKAPYKVNWQVINSSKTNHLYQPRSEKLPEKGITPLVQIDHAPDYYIVFDVIDACGSKQEQVAYINCKSGVEKTNTLFIEPIKKQPQKAVHAD